MIRYEIEKRKGFRGYKFIAESIVTDKGKFVDEHTPEGTDIINIRSEIQVTKSDGKLTPDIKEMLDNALGKEIAKFKPLYEIN